MAQRAPHHVFSFAEYLRREQEAEHKHEWLDGEIFAMAGGTPEHAAIAAEIIASLARQIPASCRVYSSDLRVRIVATGLATYPDVTVVCGPLERDPESPTHVTNPKLVVEVLSPSTAEYDRGEKLTHYRRIPSLSAIVLVEHASPRIELWSRDGDRWEKRTYGPSEELEVAGVAKLSVDDVYAAAQGG